MADKTLPDSESARSPYELAMEEAAKAVSLLRRDDENYSRHDMDLANAAISAWITRTNADTIDSMAARITKLEEALKEADRHLNDHDAPHDVIRRYVADVVRRALTEGK